MAAIVLFLLIVSSLLISCLSEYRHYIHKGSDVNTNCGCPPDAAVSTTFDTRAYVFSENSFWFYDLFEDSTSVSYSKLTIGKEFIGLPSYLDAAVNVFNDFLFVKEDQFWVYNHYKRLLAYGNTSEMWTNFPGHVDAMDVVRDIGNSTREIKVFSDVQLYLCNVTRKNYVITCDLDRSLSFNHLEQQVGFPVRASVTLKSGQRVIFGTDFMCIATSPFEQCILLCHFKIFPCPNDTGSSLIQIALIGLMMVAWMMMGLFFCEAVVNSNSIYQRRGF
ncbi:hypothetical protein HDE_07543 [Halotydeus destructor]|nr:hypothetical protein HDE_07543 [Halotydeus destructor]